MSGLVFSWWNTISICQFGLLSTALFNFVVQCKRQNWSIGWVVGAQSRQFFCDSSKSENKIFFWWILVYISFWFYWVHLVCSMIFSDWTHFSSPVIWFFKNASFSWHFFTKSQLLLCFVKCVSFNEWGAHYRVFEHSQVVLGDFQCMYEIKKASQ